MIDQLEERGLVERQEGEGDRRAYALHLTMRGGHMLREVGLVARAQEAETCAALNAKQRASLAKMLRAIAEHDGLLPGVHPGLTKQ